MKIYNSKMDDDKFYSVFDGIKNLTGLEIFEMSRPTELLSGHSLVDYASISDYFIHNILQADNADFDFSLDQILYLCDIEPHDCGALIGTLETVLGRHRNI